MLYLYKNMYIDMSSFLKYFIVLSIRCIVYLGL